MGDAEANASPAAERVAVADLREGRTPAVDLQRVRAVAMWVLDLEDRREIGLSLTLVGDERMATLHEKYMGISGPTDVLAFPLDDGIGPLEILGEVVVSVETAQREARERGLSLEREVLLYVVHGTLHLLGYDDHEPEERARMHARQEEHLAGFLSHPQDVI